MVERISQVVLVDNLDFEILLDFEPILYWILSNILFVYIVELSCMFQ